MCEASNEAYTDWIADTQENRWESSRYLLGSYPAHGATRNQEIHVGNDPSQDPFDFCWIGRGSLLTKHNIPTMHIS